MPELSRVLKIEERLSEHDRQLAGMGEAASNMQASVTKLDQVLSNAAKIIARNEVHSEQQAEINQNVQLSLKELGSQLRQVQSELSHLSRVPEEIRELRQGMKEMGEKVQEIDKIVVRNETKLGPLWAILNRALMVAVGAAVMWFISGKE